MTEEQFLASVQNQSKLVIYGAGKIGKLLFMYLEQKHISVTAFAVTDYEGNKEILMDTPVWDLEMLKKNKDACVIVGVTERYKSAILHTLEENQIQNKLVLEDDLYESIKLHTSVSYKQIESLEDHVASLERKAEDECRYIPRKLLKFEVHVTEHCNLNCQGCYHFSPVAKEYYLPVEEYERDCKRLSELYHGDMSNIGLLGGEPLLHPQITEFFRVTRENFPYGRIWLLTNGILLPKMNDDFWEACAKYKIDVSFTRYPIDVDYDGIVEKLENYGIHCDYHNDVKLGEKTLIQYPLDLTGDQSCEWNFKHCHRVNNCITLKHGRLYTCVIAAHFHHLKDYFNLDTVKLSDRDSIDIYEAKSADEISQFLVEPIPFCRYCNLKKEPKKLEWCVSKKKREEWL